MRLKISRGGERRMFSAEERILEEGGESLWLDCWPGRNKEADLVANVSLFLLLRRI